MSTIGDQIIEALEEALADTKGSGTGVRRHTVVVPLDEADAESSETNGTPSTDDGEHAKRRRA